MLDHSSLGCFLDRREIKTTLALFVCSHTNSNLIGEGVCVAVSSYLVGDEGTRMRWGPGTGNLKRGHAQDRCKTSAEEPAPAGLVSRRTDPRQAWQHPAAAHELAGLAGALGGADLLPAPSAPG
jgi:hypothetical protein